MSRANRLNHDSLLFPHSSAACLPNFTGLSRGRLSNNNGDLNENGKKARGLDCKTRNLHVHHAFLYILLPSLHESVHMLLHDYDVKMPSFTFCGGRKRKTTFIFFSWTSIRSLSIHSRKKKKKLPTGWTGSNKLDKVWSSANSLFEGAPSTSVHCGRALYRNKLLQYRNHVRDFCVW